MNKILAFVVNFLVCIGIANGAVRDGTNALRAKGSTPQTQSRISTKNVRSTTARTSVLTPRAATNSPRKNTKVSSRKATTKVDASTSSRSATARPTANISKSNSVIARATGATGALMSSTRIGAEYERCKNTYFSCMDQFCLLKNDDYRRCSCNDRVFGLSDARAVLQSAGEKLTIFTENLDVVSMTASQATAMRTESDGELALKSDNSASKALLQAIMNSIRGEDSSVGGKYSDLNSVQISFDTVNAFGTTDVGQTIAAYDGLALYNAVYPQCREAVREDCTDSALQRAITAYLMAIEQDCNTVQTAIENKQKDVKSAIREGSAMLDLARVENRQKHNSSDFTTCVNSVQAAIQSEEVCGANYHKCLDNGEYIDITTGKPITGVEDFYKLEQLLVFADGVDAASQKLSKNLSNRTFVNNFESRTKAFAKPALDTCVEIADEVWTEYLDMALLDIYYAQKSKVAEIKQDCFDYVATCYMNEESAVDSAISELSSSGKVVLQPDKILLGADMCSDYVESCNNMFDGNIIAQYIENIQQTDTLTACRAIVKQCFTKYGGSNYENFYYPYSGLFEVGFAPDWFTLYDYTDGGTPKIKSECAKQLQEVSACSSPEILEAAFGGFDKVKVDGNGAKNDELSYPVSSNSNNSTEKYGIIKGEGASKYLSDRFKRSSGVATEVYNQIISILTTQCMNLQGRFVETQTLDGIHKNDYPKDNGYCSIDVTKSDYNLFTYKTLAGKYGLPSINTENNTENNTTNTTENVCPRDYMLSVDTKSWGACLCWENGGRRSEDGASVSCVAKYKTGNEWKYVDTTSQISPANQVCLSEIWGESTGECENTGEDDADYTTLPKGIVLK